MFIGEQCRKKQPETEGVLLLFRNLAAARLEGDIGHKIPVCRYELLAIHTAVLGVLTGQKFGEQTVQAVRGFIFVSENLFIVRRI